MTDLQASNKVSAQQDDRLKSATEGMMRANRSTHAQEWKDPEPSGEDQPDVDHQPHGTMTGGMPNGMNASDVEDRSQLATYLGRVYPADRETLLDAARRNSAPDRFLAELASLPEQHTFDNVQEVWAALGHGVEDHRF